MSRSARHPAAIAAGAIAFAALAVLLWRMRYGVDFSDESFYVALPLRFVLGDRPFVDELNIAETAGLLLYPFVWIYTAIVGSASGIFLYIRVLYIVFFGLVGWSGYALARTRVSLAAALLVGTACVCFIPYGLAGLSYNTFSMGLFALGLFVAARWLLLDRRTTSVVRSAMFWAGVAHAAATFAYPSLLLGVLSTAVAIVALANGQRVRATLTYAAGGAAFCVLVSPIFLAAGRAGIRDVMAYSGGSSASASFTREVFSARLTLFLAQYPQLPFAALVCAVALTLARRYPLLTAVALFYLPFLAKGSLLTGPQASLGFVSCFALLGPIFALGLRDRRTARVLFFVVAMPSGVAGTVAALSSGNGVLAVALGLYPGAILTALLVAIFVDDTLRHGGWAHARPWLALAPAPMIWVLITYILEPDSIYRDGRRPLLTAKVTEGPFKGIYTEPAKRDFMRMLDADVRAHTEGDRALFVYDLPIGYLMAYKKPLVTSPWIFALPSRMQPDALAFRRKAQSGELVVVDRLQPSQPLDAAILELCTPVAHRSGAFGSYTTYVVR